MVCNSFVLVTQKVLLLSITEEHRKTMKTQVTIQEKLKDLRVERGLTLDQLAAEVDISRSALGAYENNDYKASATPI